MYLNFQETFSSLPPPLYVFWFTGILSIPPDQSIDQTMEEKQDTTMVIEVDLECEKCHKKIKKILCKIPEIQNQKYDKKANTVTITVVCCSPEKIKKKIYCKGGKAVNCIKITEPEKEKKEKPHGPEKPPDPKPPGPIPPETPKQDPGCPPYRRTCCNECYEGLGGGPCFHGYGRPTPLFYESYGRSVYSWDGCSCRSRGYYVCRCEYVCESNPSSCTIM